MENQVRLRRTAELRHPPRGQAIQAHTRASIDSARKADAQSEPYQGSSTSP